MATYFFLLVILAIINCCSAAGTVKIGGTCTANGDCEGSNIACSADNKCKCDQGYHGADGATCVQTPANTVGGACTGNTCTGQNVDCPTGASQFCTCKDGFTANPGDSGCGTPIAPNKVGGSCTGETCEGNNVECPTSGSKFCRCKDGYTAAIGSAGCDTVMANRVGGSCTISSCGANAECSTTLHVCACKQGFTGNKGDATCVNSKGENPCATSDCGAATKGGASQPVSSLVGTGFIISLLLNVSAP